MIDLSFWSTPAGLGIIALIPTVVGGLVAWRRTKKMDESTKQTDDAVGHASSVQQVIDGFSDLVTGVQNDNAAIRLRLDACEAENVTLRGEVRNVAGREATLTKENAGLKARIGELEHENAGLKRRIVELEKAKGK